MVSFSLMETFNIHGRILLPGPTGASASPRRWEAGAGCRGAQEALPYLRPTGGVIGSSHSTNRAARLNKAVLIFSAMSSGAV
jgi:hypothetical protein